MAKKNEIYLVFVVGLLMLGALYIGMTYFGHPTTLSIPSQLSNISKPSSTTSAPVSLACSTTSVSPKLSLTAYYNNTATIPATATQIATAYKIYSAGNPIALASGTTSATSATNVTNVNCGNSYEVQVGDNSAYFLVQSSSLIDQVNKQKTIQLQPISLPTIQFKNGSTAGFTSNAIFKGIANGYTETQLETEVSAGQGFFGNPSYALMFAYNSTQIQSIQVSGASTVSVPSSAVSIPAGYSTYAILEPQIGNYAKLDLNPIIVTGTLPSNTAIPSTINVYAISEASYNNNGAFENGLFVSPSTQTPLVTAVSSVASGSGTGGILVYG